jgi:hypothetical protein
LNRASIALNRASTYATPMPELDQTISAQNAPNALRPAKTSQIPHT